MVSIVSVMHLYYHASDGHIYLIFVLCQDGVFQEVSQLEDQQCVRRFLCEVASGELSAPEYLSTVKSLQTENLNALVGTAELPYSEAVKYGAKVKSIKQCQTKYSCSKTGLEMLLAAGLQGA